MRNPATLPLLVLALSSTLMLAAWLRQRRTRNAGIVDLAWTASLGLASVLYASLLEGWWPRRLLVVLLVGLWSLRLCRHLARRLREEPEDGRYAALRVRLGAACERWMLGFFQLQALLAALLSLTYLVPCLGERPGWRPWDALALALWTLAWAGEALADRQLHAWRREPSNAGRTCRAGLWRYSRHPNYFFEWLQWLALALLSVGLPHGYLAWIAPVVMLYLILRVTGIPPTEAQALRSRGQDYADYQRCTNAFFPGPPRRTAAKPPTVVECT